MKLLSVVRRPAWVLLGAMFFSWCNPVPALPTNAAFQVSITLPTNGSAFMPPTNILINALATNPPADLATMVFEALPQLEPGPKPANPQPPLQLGAVSNGVAVGPSGSQSELFSFTWTNAWEGTWTLVAQAVNSNGDLLAQSFLPPTIVVQAGPLVSVSIASPTNAAVFAAPANIELIATASESGGGAIADVEFFDGLKSLGVVSNFAIVDPPGSPGLPPGSHAYILNWTNASVGLHLISASATDATGNSAFSEPVIITVDPNGPPATNVPPPLEVRIISPPNFAVFRAPVDIPLSAYASEAGGAISNVQFFAGTNSLGFGIPLEQILPPLPSNGPVPAVFPTNIFGLVWSNAPVGTNLLTALATDNSGLSATSAPVSIVVASAPPPPTNAPSMVSILATDPVAIAGTNCWSWLGLSNTPPSWSAWISPAAIWQWFTNCGPQDASFTVHRTGPTNDDLTIAYSMDGTASNGVDFVTLPGAVTIPAGQANAAILIVPIENSTNPAVKTIVLTLLTNEPPVNPMSVLRAEALIVNSEASPSGLGGELLAGGSFVLSAPGPDGAWFRIDYSIDALHWTPLCTNQVINGAIDFADPNAAASQMRLYRAVPLPGPPSN